MLAGRALLPSDETNPDANSVAVLTYDYWLRRFGATRSIVGEKLLINAHPYEVIGVTAPGFRGVVSGQTPDVLVPVTMKAQITPTWNGLLDRKVSWLNVLARLRPGVSTDRAQAEMGPLFHSIEL